MEVEGWHAILGAIVIIALCIATFCIGHLTTECPKQVCPAQDQNTCKCPEPCKACVDSINNKVSEANESINTYSKAMSTLSKANYCLLPEHRNLDACK